MVALRSFTDEVQRFLANPRLVTRLREDRTLEAPDFATFYTPDAKVYTDYPIEP